MAPPAASRWPAGAGSAATSRASALQARTVAGLARQLIDAQAEAWSKAGLQRVFLEVIAQNPARALYRQAGFEELRTLDVLEGSFEAREHRHGDDARPCRPRGRAHGLRAVSRPTWRRELPTVLDAIDNENAMALGVTRGAAVSPMPSSRPPATRCPTPPPSTKPRPTACSTRSRPRAPARAGGWSTSPPAARSSMQPPRAARRPVIRQIEMALTFIRPVNARPSP
jgi:hypothetical protein